MHKENKFKKYNMLLNIILVATLFLSIGYAQITATNLQIEGTAKAYEKEGVYISGVNYSTSNNANVEASSTKQRVGATVASRIILGNTQTSSITYQVTATNGTNKKYMYVGPAVSESFYSNNDIQYDVSGINVGDVVNPNDSVTFNLTYSYVDNVQISTQTQELDAYINFGFREMFDITYSNINGSGYPDYVVKYKASDGQPNELNVDFGTNAPETLTITGQETSTEYVLGTDYTYQNGVLNFPNVTEPLHVAGPIPNDPPVITTLSDEQQTTDGEIKLLFAATDDHGIDHYEIETYEMVSGVETLLSTNTATGDATDYTVTNLQEGTYFFKVRAVDIYGLTVEATTPSKEYRWNYTATINIQNGGPNGTTAIHYGNAYNVTLTVNNGYRSISNMVVTMGGNTLTTNDYSFDETNGDFSIPKITGDISITGRASTNFCLIEGTKVKLANNKTKKIEDITYDDLLLVWSYEEGKVVEEYPLWIEKGKKATSYTRITFSDHSTINIYLDHAFFSTDINQFVKVQDQENFHIGTKVLKVMSNNELKEVSVEKIETIQEEKMYYFVASTRYYNIISDDFITTDAYTDITNLYEFNQNATWKNPNVQELDYKYLEDVLPYYLYKGFRAGEVAILLNANKTNLNEFKYYIKNIVLAEDMLLKPEEKNGSRYWMVSTGNTWNSTKKKVKEGTYYQLPYDHQTKYWYSTSENKTYLPGEKVQVWTGMHFVSVK